MNKKSKNEQEETKEKSSTDFTEVNFEDLGKENQ